MQSNSSETGTIGGESPPACVHRGTSGTSGERRSTTGERRCAGVPARALLENTDAVAGAPTVAEAEEEDEDVVVVEGEVTGTVAPAAIVADDDDDEGTAAPAPPAAIVAADDDEGAAAFAAAGTAVATVLPVRIVGPCSASLRRCVSMQPSHRPTRPGRPSMTQASIRPVQVSQKASRACGGLAALLSRAF
jgi:hypothetical protein